MLDAAPCPISPVRTARCTSPMSRLRSRKRRLPPAAFPLLWAPSCLPSPSLSTAPFSPPRHPQNGPQNQRGCIVSTLKISHLSLIFRIILRTTF